MSTDRIVRVGDVWRFSGDPSLTVKVDRLWGLKMNGTHECALSDDAGPGSPKVRLRANGEPEDDRWERVQ